jgi:Domain of unknown function (DUF222)
MNTSMRTAETSLDELLGIDVHSLLDHELVEAMMAARKLASRVQAVELAAVAELAGRRFAEDAGRDDGRGGRAVIEVLSPRDYVRDEVAEALTLTSTSADELIRFATELTERLPGTFAALAAGEIDQAKARALWRGTDQIDAGLARTIETLVLTKAPAQTTGEIRAKTRRLVRRLAPEALTRRRQEAEERRGVALIRTDDATAHLTGIDLPADAASAAYGRLTAIATAFKRDGDHRGIDQLRADVFLALLRGTLTNTDPVADTSERPIGQTTREDGTGNGSGSDPGWSGVDDAVADIIADAVRTELTALSEGTDGRHRDSGSLLLRVGGRVTESLATFTDRPSDADTPSDADRSRGMPPGVDSLPDRHQDVGVLIAEAGKRITRTLADLRGRWCKPGSAPADGSASSHGHPGYRPTAAMRRLLEHRDRRCCFPGCRRPVRHCDADHSVPFHAGGVTCPCNLAMLCRRHHRLKQTSGWRIEHIWPGVILWITPTGHWRITAPADRE